jgi:hypothetical protein
MGILFVKQDVIDLIGSDAVSNITDDGDLDNLIEDAITDAESWIFSKLSYKYTAATLAQAPLIKKVGKYYAAHLLTQRRGGSFYYGDAFEILKDEVLDIRDNLSELADASGNLLNQDASNHLPISMQNLVVDERHPQNRIRTRTESSVQTADTNQFIRDGLGNFFGV